MSAAHGLASSVRVVTLFSASGCHLCAQAKAVLARVRREIDFRLEEVSIDGDPRLEALYRTEIPVVLVDGRKRFKYRVDPAKLLRALQEH